MLLNLLATVLCISHVTGQSCPLEGISSYARMVGGNKMRHTTLQNGNYTIQALLTFTTGGDCWVVSKDGLIKSYVLKYAIDEINKGNLMDYNVKLGLQLDDVCGDLPMTMSRGIEVVSYHRPNSKCRADHLLCNKDSSLDYINLKRATAVIGSEMSFTTIPLASLTSLYNITHVSYASSNRLLSNKELYRSFFRTIPSDITQVLAMVDVFKVFKWNYVFAIGSDDDYGKLAIQDLKREANKSNICLSNEEYIPFQSKKTKERVAEVIKQIKESKATVVVLFCYMQGLGNYILEQAEKEGLRRIWLTSEEWNPIVTSLPAKLRSQTEGLLSVSLKTYKLPKFIGYMKNEIKNNWKCNMWLQLFLRSHFNCFPTSISSDKLSFSGEYAGEPCTLNISEVMKMLEVLPGKLTNLIDSVTAIGNAIHEVLKDECNDFSCLIDKIPPKKLVDKMHTSTFKNEQGKFISFDGNGDPSSSSYTLENLQFREGKPKPVFKQVGEWHQSKDGKHYFEINKALIKWPKGLPTTKGEIPSSHCHRECNKGEAVIKRSGCCWECIKCLRNDYTDVKMALKCKSCGRYFYTLDHTKCIRRPILWLDIRNPAGMSIIIVTFIGMIVLIGACVVSYKLRHILTLNDPTPHLLTMACVLMSATLIYGPLHVLEPTHSLCKARNSIFFMLLMVYCAILLIQSRFMIGYLQSHADNLFKGNLLVMQVVFLLILLLMESGSIAAWLYIDRIQVKEFPQFPGPDVHEIWKQCEVSFTAARLVSTFIPCIVLIIGTFLTFRERNLDHSFYEPKFLSFTCIALCILIVAFLPTFKYVVGIYKAIVMSFTISVFGFTFLACLVLPKVYVAVVRNKYGIGEYPMKPGIVKKKSEKEKVAEIRAANSTTNITTEPNFETTDLTNSSMSPKNQSICVKTYPSDNKFKRTDKEAKQNGAVYRSNVYKEVEAVFQSNAYENVSYDDDFNMDDNKPSIYGSYCGIKCNSVDRNTKL